MLVIMERFIEVDGAKLRELRRRRMLSLRELEKRSGVAFDNINKLENEKRRAQPRTLRKLAEALGVEPHELMKGEEMPATGDRITKREDGRWMGRSTVQTSTGTERRSVYGRTYKEAEKKLALAMGDAARGIVYDDENQTVGKYMIRWLSDSAKHTVKATTYRAYESQIRNHIVPALGKVKLSKLMPAHLQALYAAKLREGMKPASVRQIHAILHKALEQAVRFNLIPTNPAGKVDPPKVRQEEITPLSAEQANKLLDVTRDERDRFEAIYVLALTTGLRIGELLGLKWGTWTWKLAVSGCRGSCSAAKGA